MQIIFGGTFDPIHLGHISIVDFLTDCFPNASIRLIPNNIPPHREVRADAYHRMQMLKLAIENKKNVSVDCCEVKRSGISYTVETLENYRSNWPEDSLIFVVGADVPRKIPEWHRAEEILRFANLCVVSRPGPNNLIENINWSGNESTIEDLKFTPFGRSHYLNAPLVDISSTDIRRNLIKREKNIPVPLSVLRYIYKNKLYEQDRA